jgi:hypothetical protein
MRVRINDDELYDVRFKFEYRQDEFDRVEFLKDTICTISGVDESKKGRDKYNKVNKGTALLSHKDKFNKYAGKKLAFARALTTFNKKDRTEFWRIYKEKNTGRKLEVHVKK